jgi:hypothetical protein
MGLAASGGAWAAPQQEPFRQTVPTRVRTATPTQEISATPSNTATQASSQPSEQPNKPPPASDTPIPPVPTQTATQTATETEQATATSTIRVTLEPSKTPSVLLLTPTGVAASESALSSPSLTPTSAPEGGETKSSMGIGWVCPALVGILILAAGLIILRMRR